MRRDGRLSRMLHVLIHLDGAGTPLTSETIAGMLATNPVVVRRTMAGLRDAGLVTSGKGHGGGWALARGLDETTVGDVHRALGAPAVFAIGPSLDRPECPIERQVGAALTDALAEAEARLVARMDALTLADLKAGAV